MPAIPDPDPAEYERRPVFTDYSMAESDRPLITAAIAFVEWLLSLPELLAEDRPEAERVLHALHCLPAGDPTLTVEISCSGYDATHDPPVYRSWEVSFDAADRTLWFWSYWIDDNYDVWRALDHEIHIEWSLGAPSDSGDRIENRDRCVPELLELPAFRLRCERFDMPST